MNIKEFIEAVKDLGININKEHEELFLVYYQELINYNKKCNLTAITDKEMVYLKHFYDSITATRIIDFSNISTVLDIGSGAGFPGIILKIIFPHLILTVLDSNNKKTAFLETIIKKLHLENVEVINKRAEEYYRQTKLEYDLVISRAVASLPILCELSLPFCKMGGYFLSMKANVEAEMINIERVLKILNSDLIKMEKFNLPVENSVRTLILIEKKAITDPMYPRSYNKILKNPLNLS